MRTTLLVICFIITYTYVKASTCPDNGADILQYRRAQFARGAKVLPRTASAKVVIKALEKAQTRIVNNVFVKPQFHAEVQQICRATTEKGVVFDSCYYPPVYGVLSKSLSSPVSCSIDCAQIYEKVGNVRQKLCSCNGSSTVTFTANTGKCSSLTSAEVVPDQMHVIQCYCAAKCTCTGPTDWRNVYPKTAVHL
jgi:hypothetical protein